MNYTIRGSLAGCCTEVGGSRWTSLLDESSRNGSQVHSSKVLTHPPQYRMSMTNIESCPHLGQSILSLLECQRIARSARTSKRGHNDIHGRNRPEYELCV